MMLQPHILIKHKVVLWTLVLFGLLYPAHAQAQQTSEPAPDDEVITRQLDEADDNTSPPKQLDTQDNPAQESEVTAEDSAPAQEEEELSDEELKALEAALAEDLEAQEDTPSSATAASTQGFSQSTMGRTLQSMNPDISLILDVAAAGFSNTPLQGGAHDPNQNGFNLQQLEMHIESNVDPFFELQANIVFSQFGVEVEEAYARTLALPANLQLKAGQFLTQMGRLNPTHPHSWSFLDQPLVNGKFLGGEGSRGLGMEVSYLTPLPWFVELTASSTMATGACCARSFYGGQDLGVNSPTDLLYTTRMEHFFALSDSFSLLWGTSAQFGPNPTGLGNRTEIYATDLYLRWRPLNNPSRTSVSLQVEAMHRRRQTAGDILVDNGGYGQLVWDINFRHALGVRYDFVEGIAGGLDTIDPEWTENRQRATAQWTFYPSHFSRLRLQAGYDNPGWYERPILIAMLGAEVLIGAHGAHGY